SRLEVDVDRVALLHGDLAVARGEFVDGNGALALVADIDGDAVASDPNHPAGDDVTGLRALQALLEEGGKVLFGSGHGTGLLRRYRHQRDTPWGKDCRRRARNRKPIALFPYACKTKGLSPQRESPKQATTTASIRATTCASVRPVVSSWSASAAGRSGEWARALSRR